MLLTKHLSSTWITLAYSSVYDLFRWSRTPAKERAKLLNKIADAIEARLEEFAIAESRDQGKPVWLARAVDIPRACLNFRFFATSISHQIHTLVI